MKWLYKVVAKPVLVEPYTDLSVVPAEYRQRVTDYVNRRRRGLGFNRERYGDRFIFYLLAEVGTISLPHQPRLRKNSENHCYIRLQDLLSGQMIVQVSSALQLSPEPVNTVIPPIALLLTRLEESERHNDGAGVRSIDELPFNPYGLDTGEIEIERERVASAIYARRGQLEFRQNLITVYSGRCAFSRYAVVHSLEAAHIVPYCGTHSNDITNGLLLRCDIHTLFDLDLIRVDTSNSEDYRIELDIALLDSSYKDLHGKTVALPRNRQHWPSELALKYRRENLSRKS